MKIVGVQFENRFKLGTFAGREYSYYVADDVELHVSDVVKVPSQFGTGKAKVRRFLTESQVDERILPSLKTIKQGPIDSVSPAPTGQISMEQLANHGIQVQEAEE